MAARQRLALTAHTLFWVKERISAGHFVVIRENHFFNKVVFEMK